MSRLCARQLDDGELYRSRGQHGPFTLKRRPCLLSHDNPIADPPVKVAPASDHSSATLKTSSSGAGVLGGLLRHRAV